MDETRTLGRLHELSEPTRSALRQALEQTRAQAPEHEQTELYRAVLVAAGMASGDRVKDGAARWADPATLSPEQRVIAEILAGLDQSLFLYRVPHSQRLRRQWLALERPGPLFTVRIADRPAYLALRGVAPADALAAIAALPAADAVPLLVEMLVENEFLGWNGQSLLDARTREVDASLGPWAAETAELMTRMYKPVGYPGAPPIVALPVYLALARGRVPIDARWEYFFPAAFFGQHPAESRECLEAVAPERRDGVLLAALRRFDPAGLRLEAALPVLSVHPTPAIACFVRDNARGARKPLTPGAVNKTLKALAAQHPAVAAALGAKPAPITLTVAATRSSPALDDLDPISRLQLATAQERYGGTRLPVEALYDANGPTDDQIHPSLLAHLELHRDGRRAYDLWRYMGDSGTLFVAGTDQVAGEIVQNDLECADPEVQKAVTAALKANAVSSETPSQRTKAEPRPPARKKASKKR